MGKLRTKSLRIHRRSPQSVGLLFTAALPLIVPMASGDPMRLVPSIVVFGLFIVAAMFLYQALKIESGDSRTVRAHWPRKLFGAIVLGLGVAVLTWSKMDRFVLGAALGFASMGLTLFTYGIDEIDFSRIGRKSAPRSFEDDARLLDTVRRVLNAIVLRVETLEDPRLARYVISFRNQFTQLVSDDLVLDDALLEEIRDAITQAAMATDTFYLDYQDSQDPAMRDSYINTLSELLADLETMISMADRGHFIHDAQGDALFEKMGHQTAA